MGNAVNLKCCELGDATTLFEARIVPLCLPTPSMQKESRQKSQTVPNAAPQRAATMGSRWRFRVDLGPCGPRAVRPRSGRFATFVAIPFACWASGGTRAR